MDTTRNEIRIRPVSKMDTTRNGGWIRNGYDSFHVVPALQTYRPYALPEADTDLEACHG